MKVSENQIKVIDSIISIIKTWKITNDIYSPTHENDIHDYLFADLNEIFSLEELEEMEHPLVDLLWYIRHA